MDFCKSTPEHHWYTVKIYFSNLPGTVFSAWVPFVLDCRAAQARFCQQNFTAGFRSPDSGSPDSAVLDPGSPIPAESPLSLSPPSPLFLSIYLTSHFLSPLTSSLRVLTSLTGHPQPRDIGVPQLRYGDDGEAEGQFQGGRQVTERRLKGAAPLELWRASPPADYGTLLHSDHATLYNARTVVTLIAPLIS